ncbi:hypothetical protein EJ08DRAFT_437739 [Tothia fuscella]|uniref:Xylanolytic transcriptional activator regulatory domain-containing protein n=1 Tax=Tothia fuscella TaxID=1048955 RepID=A0A9P4NYR0_9PEZI|nr:hypothetical protein EJ08DRAFT_437739 [Tothia fuscella]
MIIDKLNLKMSIAAASQSSDEAILDEVHGWLGLSLDFLQNHSTSSLPSITASSGSPDSIPENAENAEAVIIFDETSEMMPVEDFDVPDWEVPLSKNDFGIIGNPFTQLPGELDERPLSSCLFRTSKHVKGTAQTSRLMQKWIGQNTLAFQSLSCYGDDSPVGLLESKYGIILGPFLDELKVLFFQNVHPYYPVVDEYDFDAMFFYTVEKDVLRKSRALVLSAMLLCSSMYLNSRQLYGFGKWTQQNLQYFAFKAVNDLYENLEDGDQYCMAQACILLSYWGPVFPPEDHHMCSDWLDKAFTHAKKAGLDQATSEVMTDRSHLIWCCCLVRDRIMSFSNRRPANPLSKRDKSVRIHREDFGLELCLPRYSNPNARGKVVESFLMLYQLSETLIDIGEFVGKMKSKLADKDCEITRQDVLHASSFDVQLRQWKRGFKISQSEPRMAPWLDSKGSYYIRTIVAESATASLYLPFITLTNHTDAMVNKYARTSLQKVKDAAVKVAETTRDLLATVRPEEMPPCSLWLPLPILTLLVSLKYNHRRDSGVEENSDIIRLRHLFSALKVFRTRYRSGQFVFDLVTQVSRDLHLGLWDLDGKPVFEVVEAGTPGRGKFETDVLTKAAAMIDAGIKNDNTGNSDR